jgi:hypothetical protein
MSRTSPSPDTCAARALADLDEAAKKGHSTVRKYLKTLVKDAGWKVRSTANMQLIQAALTNAGVFTDVNITDMRLSRERWVHLARQPFPATTTGPEFEREEDLNAYLQDWHREAFAGIRSLEELQFVRAEKPIDYDGTICKIDLLFEDDEGTAVLVDLKAGEPQDDTIKKLRRYLNACRIRDLQPLRGVLITGIPTTEQAQKDILAELAELRADYEVDWYQYRLGITLERVD